MPNGFLLHRSALTECRARVYLTRWESADGKTVFTDRVAGCAGCGPSPSARFAARPEVNFKTGLDLPKLGNDRPFGPRVRPPCTQLSIGKNGFQISRVWRTSAMCSRMAPPPPHRGRDGYVRLRKVRWGPLRGVRGEVQQAFGLIGLAPVRTAIPSSLLAATSPEITFASRWSRADRFRLAFNPNVR